jgi:preprotein translocase subunit SecF
MMSRLGNIGGRLYRGDVSVNFVKRQRMWYSISGIILLVSVVALLVRGLNYSVDFKGGAQFSFKASGASQQQITQVVSTAAHEPDVTVQLAGTGSKATWQVQTGLLKGSGNVLAPVQNAIAGALHIPVNSINSTYVGPTWGSSITHKAVEALIVFLVLIVAYLTIAFEWKMAVSAFVALLHDIVITVGVYALTGFQVSPATVIGLLTILGYSLYDTVVVFDKVRENTAGILISQKSSYSDAANLALNQTLVRSINTSLIALLPVASILFVGAGLLGAGTLKDLSLVLFVGMLSGTYSSICIATPVLADLKERERRYQDLSRRVAAKAAGGRAAKRQTARAGATAAVSGAAVSNGGAGSVDVAEPVEDDVAGGEDGVAGGEDGVAGGEDTESVEQEPATPVSQGTLSRQQPRRSTAAQRRPSGRSGGSRKKRR